MVSHRIVSRFVNDPPGSRALVVVAALMTSAFLASSASGAVVVGPPTIILRAGGTETNIPTLLDPGTGMYLIGATGTGFNLRTTAFEVSLNGALDPDPSIAYGVALTNFTAAPMVFSLLVSMPMVLPAGSNAVKGSIVGGLTDFTGDGVALLPVFAKAQQSYVSTGGPLTSMGVDVGDPLVAGPGPSGSFYPYGPFALGPYAGPPGAWTILDLELHVSLSGGGDIAALTGFTEIVSAPEPATFASALLLVGLTLGGGWARRRCRSAA